MYRVVVERSAEKDLKRLPFDVRSRVANALRSLANNPRVRSAAANSLEQSTTGGFAWATIV